MLTPFITATRKCESAKALTGEEVDGLLRTVGEKRAKGNERTDLHSNSRNDNGLKQTHDAVLELALFHTHVHVVLYLYHPDGL